MSISHMPKPSSIMQGLPHHLQSSLVQNNMFGMDNAHRNLDEPNPDMLLALLARNKALEGEFPLMNINEINNSILVIHYVNPIPCRKMYS